MFNIIEQNKFVNMSIFLNDTRSATTKNGAVKFDCAKECPCGVPAIPVPDQWLEVMVTGGFKVWHIIFIIIAFVVTIIVVYCCFHRCRIPRTKQEIEADLMRTNMTSKFRDYLQEFPNEPTTFIDALKKVQELEEKSSEQDDPGARKRKVWLKLKGKDRQDKTDGTKEGAQNGTGNGQEATAVGTKKAEDDPPPPPPSLPPPMVPTNSSVDDRVTAPETDKKASDKTEKRPGIVGESLVKSTAPKVGDKLSDSNLLKSTASVSIDKTKAKVTDSRPIDSEKSHNAEPHEKGKSNEAKLVKSKGEKVDDKVVKLKAQKSSDKAALKADAEATIHPVKSAKVRRQRDKPNLSRTKVAHVGFHTESTDNHNQLNLPTTSHHHHHHHHHQPAQLPHSDQPAPDEPPPPPSANKERRHGKARTRSSPTRKVKTKEAKSSTVIQIET